MCHFSHINLATLITMNWPCPATSCLPFLHNDIPKHNHHVCHINFAITVHMMLGLLMFTLPFLFLFSQIQLYVLGQSLASSWISTACQFRLFKYYTFTCTSIATPTAFFSPKLINVYSVLNVLHLNTWLKSAVGIPYI